MAFNRSIQWSFQLLVCYFYSLQLVVLLLKYHSVVNFKLFIFTCFGKERTQYTVTPETTTITSSILGIVYFPSFVLTRETV